MRQIITAVSGAIALSVVCAPGAFAAPKAPMAPAIYNWTGFYVGLNLGYGSGKANNDVSFLPSPAVFGAPQFSAPATGNGWMGGVQAGYNWQVQSYVIGVEADIDAASIKGDSLVAPLALLPFGFSAGSVHTDSQKISALSTLRARIGFTPIDRVLVYGTGGFALGKVDTTSSTLFGAPAYTSSDSRWKSGWTAGAGVEWAALGKNWTLKAEYLYVDLGTNTTIGDAGFAPNFVQNNWKTTANIVRIGTNYKF